MARQRPSGNNFLVSGSPFCLFMMQNKLENGIWRVCVCVSVRVLCSLFPVVFFSSHQLRVRAVLTPDAAARRTQMELITAAEFPGHLLARMSESVRYFRSCASARACSEFIGSPGTNGDAHAPRCLARWKGTCDATCVRLRPRLVIIVHLVPAVNVASGDSLAKWTLLTLSSVPKVRGCAANMFL